MFHSKQLLADHTHEVHRAACFMLEEGRSQKSVTAFKTEGVYAITKPNSVSFSFQIHAPYFHLFLRRLSAFTACYAGIKDNASVKPNITLTVTF